MTRALTAGQRIASWRRLRGWSVRYLAKRAGLHFPAVSRMEKGHQEPKAEEVERIATSLGLTMPQFYGDLAENAKAS